MEEVYVVSSSDTLSGIALKYQMTVNEIKTLNHLFNNQIFPGQKLKVFRKEDANESEKNETKFLVHKVGPFETLAMIALAYDMKISDLKSINNLSSNQVRVGDTLKVKYVNKQEVKLSLPVAQKKEENNAIDITFELIKDIPPKQSLVKKEATIIKETVIVDASALVPPPEVIHSENENVDRIIKEAEKSNLNFVVNNAISEDVLKELDKLNSREKIVRKKKREHHHVVLDEEPLDPPTLVSKSTIISSLENLAKIRSALPRRYQSKKWALLYSTQEHGISYQTFLRRVKYSDASLLIVEDSQGHVFGAFVSSNWRVEDGYYGNGESFLFKLYPEVGIYTWDANRVDSNSYFMLAHNDHLEVGGGGHPGLWIDSDFYSGTSGESNTFKNPVLSSTPDFVCSVLEVWGFTR